MFLPLLTLYEKPIRGDQILPKVKGVSWLVLFLSKTSSKEYFVLLNAIPLSRWSFAVSQISICKK